MGRGITHADLIMIVRTHPLLKGGQGSQSPAVEQLGAQRDGLGLAQHPAGGELEDPAEDSLPVLVGEVEDLG